MLIEGLLIAVTFILILVLFALYRLANEKKHIRQLKEEFAMPEMNGKQLDKWVLKNPLLSHLKMVLFSGIAKLDQLDDLEEHGFSAVLFKPIFVKKPDQRA